MTTENTSEQSTHQATDEATGMPGDLGPYGGPTDVTDALSGPPEPRQPDGVVLPALGPRGWLRWGWRQLTSMRTALLLLLLLAVAAVPGSVFPQRRVNPGLVQQYLTEHRQTGPWLDRLGLFDVYSSVWFSAVYLLLFVSLVGCVLPRSRQHVKALRAAPPPAPRRLERMPAHTLLVTQTPPGQVLDDVARVLRGHRYRVARHDDSVAAERGYLAETGNLVFHLALLLLLLAVAAGSLFGYYGQALVVEGGAFSNAVAYYDSFSPGQRVDQGELAPFSFTLRRMRVRFEERPDSGQLGAPREFDADLSVQNSPQDGSREVTIRPNDPLDVAGVRVFLVGNGYAPVITVRDGRGRVAFSGPVPFLPSMANYASVGVVKAPYARPRQVGLTGLFLPTFFIDPAQGPVSLFPDAKVPRLAMAVFASAPGQDAMDTGGVPTSVYALDTSRLTQLRTSNGQPFRLLLAPGATQTLPDGAGSVTFDGLRRFAALDIRYDPTKEWVLVAALLALAGLTASLFTRRRRVWVRVSSDAGGVTTVAAAGLARGEDPRLAADVHSLLTEAGLHPGDHHPGARPAAGATAADPDNRDPGTP